MHFPEGLNGCLKSSCRKLGKLCERTSSCQLISHLSDLVFVICLSFISTPCHTELCGKQWAVKHYPPHATSQWEQQLPVMRELYGFVKGHKNSPSWPILGKTQNESTSKSNLIYNLLFIAFRSSCGFRASLPGAPWIGKAQTKPSLITVISDTGYGRLDRPAGDILLSTLATLRGLKGSSFWHEHSTIIIQKGAPVAKASSAEPDHN